MSTLRTYFEREARDCIERMAALEPAFGTVDARAELYRVARELRGVAQLAREGAVHEAAQGIENALRPGGPIARAPLAGALLGATVAELRELVRGAGDADAAAARAAMLAAQWARLATEPSPPGRGPDVGGQARVQAAGGQGSEPVPGDAGGAGGDFTAFLAHEVAAIAAALDAGVAALMADPHHRAPVADVLRRQRALLGAAKLDEVPVVAETLHAVEDLARVIVRLGVGIKGEWLDVFRSARDVLSSAAGALDRGAQPQATPALSRLRTLHEELLERYGAAHGASDETVADSAVAAPESAAGAGPELAGSTDAIPAYDEAVVDGAEGAVIDVATLCYDREAALRRAVELRGRVERAIGDDTDAREAVEELFDLLRIALG